MSEGFFSRRALAGVAVQGLMCGLLVAGCEGAEEMAEAGRSNSGKALAGLTAKTILPDGSTIPTAPITAKVFYWGGAETSGSEIYALVIGENFHAVSGCSLADLNGIVGDPFNRPEEQLEEVARKNPNTGLPYPVGARFSCGDEPGDLPYETTLFYLDELTDRYYFPTGIIGEYFSFSDGDECVGRLLTSLFKLDYRRAFELGNWMSGSPPDLSTEIQIGCDADVSSAGPYRIYYDHDCTVPTAAEDGLYLIVEAKDGAMTSHLPVYRMNGDSVNEATLGLLQDWLKIPRGAYVAHLREAPGFRSVDPSTGAAANIEKWKKNRRFWDLCLSDPLAKTPPQCTHEHYVYDAGATADAGVRAYREELLLDGNLIDRVVDAAGAASPPFLGCEGALEAMFGLSRVTAIADGGVGGGSREWATAQAQNILRSRAAEAAFRCPSTADAHVCRLSLGDEKRPDRAQTIGLRKLNELIWAAYSKCVPEQRTDALEITLNSDLEVTLLPLAYLNFGNFRAVTIKSAVGTKYVRFHEQCDDANSCVRTNSGRTRPVVSIAVGDPTRSLVVDHVGFRYVADNLMTPKDGGQGAESFFNMTVIFLRAEGTAASRLRVVLADSSIGADTESPRFLSQALAASFADVFIVRSTLQGTANAKSAWKTLAASDSLVVLDGTPTAPTLLVGAAGGARFSDGRNDVLAVNSLVQGPLVANAVSQSTWIDSTLYRSAGKEAIHFTGTEKVGFPTRYSMTWTGNSSRVTNLQHGLAVPFAQFEPGLAAVPSVMMGPTVSYFDGDGTSSGGAALGAGTVGQTLFCNTARGSVKLLNGLGERCPAP
jgi:hypothetical protein